MSIAFVFPGQGSQSVGMLAGMAEAYPQIQETFHEASDALSYDLWQLIQNGPDQELNKTHITQPAMLAGGVAIWRVWQAQNGPQPVGLAGHSLGEYSALVAAESLTFSDAVTLVAERGRLMQEAVPVGAGAMAAILGLDDEQVIAVCKQAAQDEVASAANFNSPGQVVVAGNSEAVERAITMAKEAGAKRALMLPMSVPSHCSLMMTAAEQLAERMEAITIKAPCLPVINNVDVMATTDTDIIRDALKRQLFNPVRWVETIQTFAQQGIQHIVECGPGKVLTGLNKRINRELDSHATQDVASFTKSLDTLKQEG